jgi:hypothetical protein
MSMWCCEDRRAPFVRVFERTATSAGYDLRIIRPAKEPAGFTQLKRHYRHLSPNPERFELACFRRWFEIAAAVLPGERFVQADSDLVVQTPFQRLPAELRDADALVASIGVTGDVPEEDINGGFSIWTGRRLREFCDYAVARYERGVDDLADARARGIAAGNPRASISDMTLLHRWVREAGVPFVDSNRVIGGQYVDHNLSMVSCQGSRFRAAFGRKALRFARDGVWLSTVEGLPVRPNTLHLVGRYKILAGNVERRDQGRLALKSLYLLGGRTGRRLLRIMGVST